MHGVGEVETKQTEEMVSRLSACAYMSDTFCSGLAPRPDTERALFRARQSDVNKASTDVAFPAQPERQQAQMAAEAAPAMRFSSSKDGKVAVEASVAASQLS
jgi:hypothetical protein